MEQEAPSERTANTSSQRGAELVGVIFESLKSIRILSLQELGLHVDSLFLKEVRATGQSHLIQRAEQQREGLEAECEETRQELNRAFRRLEAIKLSLEGKTDEEIEAEFAERDQ
jgi:hypothetical protein